MADRASHTVRRRRLAVELRRLRERAGLTGDEAAERLGWSASKISRIETHHIGVKPADLHRLLELYGVDAARRSELEALARESADAGRLLVHPSALTAELSALITIEAEAAAECNWEPQIVPGLLQTEGYARAIIQAWKAMFPMTREEVERRVTARLARQQLLTRDPPLQLSAVVDESVLRRKIGSSSIMREQLAHLADACSWPNVEVRVLPLDSEHPIGTGSFSYLRFTQVHDVPLSDIVNVEQLTRNYDLDQEEETLHYQIVFERLRQLSADPGKSLEIITDTRRELWLRP
jgi:transcriptional regulator with XRE-family HTH domain